MAAAAILNFEKPWTQDSVKRDSAKRDSAKWDSAKRDSAKRDSAKRDSAKRCGTGDTVAPAGHGILAGKTRDLVKHEIVARSCSL